MAGSSGANILRAWGLGLLAALFVVSVAAGVYTARPQQEARHIPLRPMPEEQILPAKVAPEEPIANVNKAIPVKPQAPVKEPAPADKAYEPQIWPVNGVVSHEFGWQQHPVFKDWRFHTGIDLPAEIGQTVLAAISGNVTGVEQNPKTGLTVKIASGPWIVHHGSLASAAVKTGDKVTAGQTIGTAGEASQEPYPHVHLAIEKNGKFINPVEVLPRR